MQSSDEKKVIFTENLNEVVYFRPDKAYQEELQRNIKELDSQRDQKKIERLQEEYNCTDEISLRSAISDKKKKAALSEFKKQMKVQTLARQSSQCKRKPHVFGTITLENTILVGRFKRIYDASKTPSVIQKTYIQDNNN